MKKRSKKKTIIALIAAGAAAAIAVTVIMPMFTSSTNAAETVAGQTMTAVVERGTIETMVVGSGSLASDSAVDITIPSGLIMESVFVSENDTVEEGDVLAVIDTASLQDALENIQSELAVIDAAINTSADGTDNEVIEADVGGRVKEIYAGDGDNVQDVMAEQGSLLLLSVDGKMKVSFQSGDLGGLAAGDSVTVTLADDTTEDGTIQSIANGTCVVTLTDNGPEAGGKAVITYGDKQLGIGTLEISSPIRVLVSGKGTIESVNVDMDEHVNSGDTLFTLTETVASSNYQGQIAQRNELESTLRTLLAYSQTNTIIAPASGMISAVNVSANGSDTPATGVALGNSEGASNTNVSAAADEASSLVTLEAADSDAAATFLSAETTGDAVFTFLSTGNTQAVTGQDNDAPANSIGVQSEEPVTPSADGSGAKTPPSAIGGELQVYINNPETGNTPQSTIMPGRGYTGTLTWSPAVMKFLEKTVYSAQVTLTADIGYQFDSSAVPAVTGGQVDAASLINTGDTLTFTVVFAPTSASASIGSSGMDADQPQQQQTQQTQQTQQSVAQSGSTSVSGGIALTGSSGSTADTTVDSTAETSSVTTESAFTIKTSQDIYLTADVDELDILTLGVGQAASVVLDALPDQVLEGEVTNISDAGTSQSGVTTYPVTILVSVPEGITVKLGMNASATIVTGASENALMIPVSALQEMGGETFVMIAGSGETAADGEQAGLGDMRAVTTGLSDGNNVEILSGLEEGETVTYFEATDTDSEDQMGFMMGGMGGGMPDSGGFQGDGEGFPQGGPPQQ